MQINTDGMTPQQLQEALEQLQKEASRGQAKEGALATMDNALQDRLQAEGIGPGGAWVKPQDASDAYPYKWIVQHEGRLYTSKTRVNMDTPGESEAWEHIDPNSDEYRRKYGGDEEQGDDEDGEGVAGADLAVREPPSHD